MVTPGKSRGTTVIETRAAPVRRLEWQLAEVREIIVETFRVKSLLLHLSKWRGHLPGQHVDIRLTAEDGYQAQRSYSIASPPEDELVTLTVEHVDNGEVSPYLVSDLRPGDQFELRGPIGGYFVWTRRDGRPSISHSRRVWNCTPDGDAASPRQAERSRSCLAAVLIQKSGRRHLSRGTRYDGARR